MQMENLQNKIVKTIIEMCNELDSSSGMEVEECSEQELMELDEEQLVNTFLQITEMIMEKRLFDESAFNDDSFFPNHYKIDQYNFGEDMQD